MQYLAHTTQSESSHSALGEALTSALMKIQVFWDDAVLTGKYFPTEEPTASSFKVYAVGTVLGLKILKMEAANSPADLVMASYPRRPVSSKQLTLLQKRMSQNWVARNLRGLKL